MALTQAAALSRGESVGVGAAVIKDLGTRYEGAVVDVVVERDHQRDDVLDKQRRGTCLVQQREHER